MQSRQDSQTKNTEKHSSAFSSASTRAMFESRPFVVQQTRENSQQPDLKTSLMQAEDYGHHLSQIDSASVSEPIAVQPKMEIGKPVQLGKTTKTKKTPKPKPYDRPDFPANYKPGYLDEFNKRPNRKSTLKSSQRLDHAGYSRNHRVSYQDQQNLIEQHHQGNLTQQQFTQSTNALYPKDKAGSLTGFGAKKMESHRKQMLAAKTPAEREKHAKKMSTYLNASHLNVTIGGTQPNSTIGSHFDPNFSKSPGGTYSLTPRTKQAFDFGVGNISKPMLSPGGTRILSSHVNDRQGGFVPYSPNAMSPNSYKPMKDLMDKGRGNAGQVNPANVQNFNTF
ncbi:hypothetical protein [Nostoc sp.]|uniref:hypothetical protein n=1 Tax=Nostoc sp. TaxID=1180 RepID=UPI002FFD3A2E